MRIKMVSIVFDVNDDVDDDASDGDDSGSGDDDVDDNVAAVLNNDCVENFFGALSNVYDLLKDW